MLTNTGYHPCPCRDCFETAIGCDEDDRPDLCHECESAGCDPNGQSECCLERIEQPEPGDWITEDFTDFREHEGSGFVSVHPSEDWRAVMRARMRCDRYWPNIWRVDDHGGVELVEVDSDAA